MTVVSGVSANLLVKWNLSRGLYIFTAALIFILEKKNIVHFLTKKLTAVYYQIALRIIIFYSRKMCLWIFCKKKKKNWKE